MEISIDAKELKLGMTITRIVYNSKGNFVIGANTAATASVIDKLQANNIKSVYVNLDELENPSLIPLLAEQESEIIEGMEIKDASGTQKDVSIPIGNILEADPFFQIPLQKHKEFENFQWDYNIKETIVKEALQAAVKGQTDVAKISRTASDLMKSLHVKSDLFTYLNRIKGKDATTFSHSLNVSLLCNLFGSWLNVSQSDLNLLTAAGMLHDVGKTQIDDAILNKPGKLNDAEFEHMKQHTVRGYRLLEPQDLDREIKLAALMHHEKLDGSGYPIIAKPEKISEITRIVSICDIYEALISDRQYRRKILPFQVIDQFQQMFFGKLDTSLMMFFLENIAQSYCHTTVELSDGSVGEIVFINKLFPARPVINVNNEFIDLAAKDIQIVKLL